jgi:hypothetical protein
MQACPRAQSEARAMGVRQRHAAGRRRCIDAHREQSGDLDLRRPCQQCANLGIRVAVQMDVAIGVRHNGQAA